MNKPSARIHPAQQSSFYVNHRPAPIVSDYPDPPETLDASFFDRPADNVAQDLIGCVLRRFLDNTWVGVQIVETEAYGLDDTASHAFRGRTPSREPMWMDPGTIYMYHSRAGPSLNISCGTGPEAVLIKAGIPITDRRSSDLSFDALHRRNPGPDGLSRRTNSRLCAGQTLLCRALELTVADWTARPFNHNSFYIESRKERPRIICALRLGITPDRDDGRLARYIDHDLADAATSNPMRRRGARRGHDYRDVGLTLK